MTNMTLCLLRTVVCGRGTYCQRHFLTAAAAALNTRCDRDRWLLHSGTIAKPLTNSTHYWKCAKDLRLPTAPAANAWRCQWQCLRGNATAVKGAASSGSRASLYHRLGQSGRTVIVLITFSAAALSYWYIVHYRGVREMEFGKIESFGKMDVGGEWSGLVDNKGNARSSADFLGRWLYLYFGYTHCPDICPEELEKIVGAVAELAESYGTENIQPVFVTIDPVRDSVERVDRYVTDFTAERPVAPAAAGDKRKITLLGLTGAPEKVSEVCRMFRIYQSEGPRDEDNDYIVDHSIITYLINPQGECVAFFLRPESAQRVAETTWLHMKHYEKQQQQLDT